MLFLKVRVIEKTRERDLPPVGSLPQPELGQTKARSFLQVFHLAHGAQTLGLFSTAFPRPLAGSRIRNAAIRT